MATPSSATQKGGIIKATNYGVLPFTPSMFQLSKPKDVELVYDPYSNKYYGTSDYKGVKTAVNAYKEQALSAYNRATKQTGGILGMLGIPAQPYNTITGRVDPVADAEKMYATAMSSAFIPKEKDYIQSYDVINSYKAYGGDWDTFFQRNFQNPRIAEENANKRARTQQAQQRNQTLASSLQDLLVESSSMPSGKKVTNTGVSSRADVFGGGLEAGLGV